MKTNFKRFLMYWVIIFFFAGLYMLGGWIIVDHMALLGFTVYSIIALPVLGLIKYFIIEFYWSKIK